VSAAEAAVTTLPSVCKQVVVVAAVLLVAVRYHNSFSL
jgi:hypothetical protein